MTNNNNNNKKKKKKNKLPKHIYKTDSGYRAQVRAYDIDKCFSIKDYGNDKEALDSAITYLKEEIAVSSQIKLDKISKRKKYTVETAFEDSLKLYARSYETNRKLSLMFYKYLSDFKDRPIKDIQPNELYEMFNQLASSGEVSSDTLSRIRSIWKQIFDVAILNKKAITNYAAAIPLPKVMRIEKKREVINYDDQLLDKVIEALRMHTNSTNRMMFDTQLIIYSLLIQNETGLRPSECYALTRDDINLDTRMISVNKRVGSTQKGKGKIVTPKTSNAYRTIPMNEKCVQVCSELLEYTDNYQLFERWYGSLLDSTFVANKLQTSCKRYGIEFRPYMLRHMFAKKLIDTNISQRTTMDLMGHASYDQSLDYSRTTQEQLLEAIEKINK